MEWLKINKSPNNAMKMRGLVDKLCECTFLGGNNSLSAEPLAPLYQ